MCFACGSLGELVDCLFGGLDQALCVASLALLSTHCFLRFVILIFIRTTEGFWPLANHPGRSTTLAMYISPKVGGKPRGLPGPTLCRSVAGFFDDDNATPDENVENRIRIHKKSFVRQMGNRYENVTTRFRARSLEYPPLQAYSFNQIYDRFLTIMTFIFTTFTSRQLQRIHLVVLRII